MESKSLSLSLQVKLGSIAVHVAELLDPKAIRGHMHDEAAIRSLLEDSEVIAWLKTMDSQGFLPKPR